MEKTIKVYNDILDRSDMENFYIDIMKSKFEIGWGDSPAIEHRNEQYWYSTYPTDEFIDSGWLSSIKDEGLINKINNRDPNQVIINCTTYSDVYRPHTHPGKEVLLYYTNLEWKQEWWGETVFYSEDLKDIIFTNQYVPGRAIWFDGSIPHSIKPQTHTGPKFRFSVSVFFDKEE
tara:strand:+ start:3178 stop:3702 length:525 start_codon:yes stop_codon:yes gene_type:complete